MLELIDSIPQERPAPPLIPPGESHYARETNPDEPSAAHSNESASNRQRDSDRGPVRTDSMPLVPTCQPAMRIEIPAISAASTATTDGYFRLRPWQERCFAELSGAPNWIINAPMAAGKT